MCPSPERDRQAMKTVTVRLYSVRWRRLSGVEDRAPVETAALTVRQLLDQLRVPADEADLVFINGTLARDGSVVRDGDEIKVFPLAEGG